MRQHPAGPDDAMERVTGRWLELEVGSLPDGPQLPAAVRREVIERVSATPQDSGIFRGRLSGRARTSWKEKLVFASAGIAAGIAVAAVIFSVLDAGVDESSLEAPAVGTSVTHTVAPDGTGQFTSVADALAMATDGDTILVAPGVYEGHLIIDKDVTLVGDGPRAEVVIEYGEDGPLTEAGAGEDPMTYGILLQDADATLRGLTVRSDIQGISIAIDGGAPQIADVTTIEPADPEGLEGAALIIRGGSEAIIRDSSSAGWVFIEEATPTFTGNEITNWFYLDAGADPLLRSNRFVGIHLREASSAMIEDNDITRSPWPEDGAPAIHVQTEGDDSRVVIRGNRIGSRDYGIGIDADRLTHAVTVENNVIAGADIGVRLQTGAVLTGNTIRDNVEEGVRIEFGAPVLTDNVIEGNAVGLLAANANARPTLNGNRICDNAVDFSQPRGGPEIDLSDNEVCQKTAEDVGYVAPVSAKVVAGDHVTASPFPAGVQTEVLKRGIHRIVADGANHKLGRVMSAAVDGSGGVWIQQGKQVFRLGRDERFGVERFDGAGVRPDPKDSELDVRADGRVVSRHRGGAVAFDGSAWQPVDLTPGDGGPSPLDWAGFGFVSFEGCVNHFETRRQAERNCGHRDVVRHETADGSSWAALDGFGGGLSRFELGVWKPMLPFLLRHGESVGQPVVSPAGDVWIMLSGRVVDEPRRVDRDGYLARWNGNAWTTFDLPGAFYLPHTAEPGDPTRADVRGVAVAPDRTIWFAVGARLVAFDGKRWKTYRLPLTGGAKGVRIQDMDLLRDGSLLVLVRYARDYGDAFFAPLWFKPDAAKPMRIVPAVRA